MTIPAGGAFWWDSRFGAVGCRVVCPSLPWPLPGLCPSLHTTGSGLRAWASLGTAGATDSLEGGSRRTTGPESPLHTPLTRVHVHTYVHTHPHPPTHAHTHIQSCVHMHTHAHACTLTLSQTHMHVCAHTVHARVHTHSHTQIMLTHTFTHISHICTSKMHSSRALVQPHTSLPTRSCTHSCALPCRTLTRSHASTLDHTCTGPCTSSWQSCPGAGHV